MAQTDSEIIQQWDEYIEDYEEKLQEAKQNSDSTLQDGTASNSDRFNSAKDYVAQEQYLQQLKSNRDILQAAYDNGQPLPNVTFDVSGMGGVCKSIFSQLSTVSQASYKSGNNIVIFETDFGAPAYVPSSSGDFGNISSIADDSGRYHAEGCKINQNTAQYASFSIVDDKGYFVTIPTQTVYMGSNGIKRYTIIEEVDPATFNINQVPVLSASDVNNHIGYVSGSSAIYFDSQFVVGKGIRYDYGQVTQDPYSDNPWDYYNDNIKDNISQDENKVYPNGYEPPNPYDPVVDPTNVPDDDGEVPDDQITRNVVGATRFITQYALTYQELSTVGVSLWTSWLTINTDVWKNFYLPYAQDFGTLNIGAALDFIISLKVYPFAFTDEMPWIGTGNGVRMGTGHTDFLGSESRIVRTVLGYLNGGTCEIPLYYDDFRDIYNTTIIAYLPYCGTVQLNPSEVVGKTLQLYYYIDFQAGSCTAVIKVIGENTTYNICAKTGQLGFSIPITATNAGQVAAQFISDTTKLYGTIANYGIGVSKSIMGSEDKVSLGLDVAEKTGSAIGSLIDLGTNVVTRSGIDVPMLSGGGSMESFKFPAKAYVQIRRGKYSKPENYGHSKGYVNNSSDVISNFGKDGTALCKFTGVDTTGLKCNDAERTEILSLLQTGVYI